MQVLLLLVLNNMYGGPRHYSSGPVPSLWTLPTPEPEETMNLVELKLNCVLYLQTNIYIFILVNTFSVYIPEDQQIECMKGPVQSVLFKA
jgi:hypothetical protein